MTPEIITTLTLLHVLVLVYWLGGDLGAYYTSRFIYDPDKGVPARGLAAKILADVDMAPRVCLLLALPTGLTLGWAKGWLAFNGMWLFLVWLVALAWILVAFAIHTDHDGDTQLPLLDQGARWVFLAALGTVGVLGVTGGVALPLFVSLKLILLGFAVLMGLLIRVRLRAFGPAFGRLMSEGPSPEVDAALRAPIARARPFVLCIWAALIAATWLGIATPT